ncbi:MAG: hypothetical protein JSW58_08335 [Candidatus Latescibacterota bacterium]|nr:MAG: hypothetical protein JSW58_08335 [Candidatus Latescibacterota bacterium]
MAISIKESEVQRLIRFYRKSLKKLSEEYVSAFDFERVRLFAQTREALRVLEQLDARTMAWARRNIMQLYRRASLEAQRRWFFRKRMSQERSAIFARVNDMAIQALLNNPEVGFLTGMKAAVQQVRDRMRVIQNQAKVLRQHQKLFDETISRVGFFQGKNLNEIRDHLVRDMVSLKRQSDLVWTRNALALPQDNIIQNVANLPYVKYRDANALTGVRNVRIDKYAEMLARTKGGQATNLARRNRALLHGVKLMQFSKNKPLQDDACFVYIGRAFALTPEAKEEYGVPLLAELPNGGCPVHPNCTHNEIPFNLEWKRPEEIALAFIPPPAWALNTTFSRVQKEYKKRGGPAVVAKLNQAAAKFGHTTGGRERLRREERRKPR